MQCDVLVLTAHPDDAELAAGGAIKKLTLAGRSVAIVDCTQGEMGTRGTPQLRSLEASAAAIILGVAHREILSMPDCAIEHTQQNIKAVVEAIRTYKPRILLTTPPVERHPDHVAVHNLARAASFTAGLKKYATVRDGVDQEPHRPNRTLCFMQQLDFPRQPDVYIDITDTFETKMEAIKAYGSQFHMPEAYSSDESQTYISRPEFFDELEARAIFHGSRIGVRYAEAFYAIEPIGLNSLADIR